MVYLTTTKWRPPQWCPFLFFYSTRREGRYKRERLNIPLHLMGNICLDLREGEIDGIISPSPLTHTPPCLLRTTQYTHVLPSLMCVCTSYFTYYEFHGAFQHLIISLLFTNMSCGCAMLYIPLQLVLLGFPPMDENLHDNVTMAHINDLVFKSF